MIYSIYIYINLSAFPAKAPRDCTRSPPSFAKASSMRLAASGATRKDFVEDNQWEFLGYSRYTWD